MSILVASLGVTLPTNAPQHDLKTLPQWAQDLIQQLTTQVHQLTARVHELEAQIAKNSSNSGKPPSSDGLSKPNRTKSLRGRSGKKPGGQVGRQGTNLAPVQNPDKIEVHTPVQCKDCHSSLIDVKPVNLERRQVFDIPPISVAVTEHRAEIKICPCCGTKNKGQFPQGVNGFTQYGDRIKALAAYFLHQHLIPFERVAQIFEDVFHIPLSPGTCVNIDRRLFEHLEAFEVGLKAHLLACQVLHFDETGVRCEKKLHWIHVTSSETATLFALHAKRGGKAIDDINILPQYRGRAVHDCWYPYFSYRQVEHGLCNVHHLRELTFVYEVEKSVWAKKMSDVLLEGQKLADAAKQAGQSSLHPLEITGIERKYEGLLIEAGIAYLEASEAENMPEGLGKQGFNLFRRLLHKTDEVLFFIRDLSVPFSNNLAEQDLRMEKVKQKISGCFRTFSGGELSCRVRSYISTARKQGWSIIDALVEAIQGTPRMLLPSIE
jgi:transposase